MYKTKLEQKVPEVKEKEHVFDNLSDALTILSKMHEASKLEPSNEEGVENDVDIDIGEDVCRIINDVQTYWSQFGFLDKTNIDVQKVVNNIMKHVKIEPCVDEVQEDSDVPLCEDPDDFLLHR